MKDFSLRASAVLTNPEQAWFFIKDDRFINFLSLSRKYFLPFLYHSLFINFLLFLISAEYNLKVLLKQVLGKSTMLPLALLVVIFIFAMLHKEISYRLTGKSHDTRSFQLFFYSFFPLLAASCLWSIPYLGKLCMIPALLITPYYLSKGTESLFSYSLEQRGIITRTMLIALALVALGALLVLAAIISFL